MEGMTTKELENLLNERLELIKQEKTAIKDAVDSLDTKIRNLIGGIGKVPNETESEINTAMQQMERAHSTTSQTSAQERQFMRDMEKLRQKKKTLQTYQKTQAEIDGMKARKSALVLELQDKDNTITELNSGLRKVVLAQKLNCELTDLYEQHINVEESKMSRVVGKGGQNLRNIESECGASVEMDRTGGGIHIMGTRPTIEAALRLIMVIVETAIEEFHLSEVTINVLFMDKSKLINEIQTRFNVRFDISRSKNTCKITGMLDAVIAAKREVLAIECLKQSLILEPSFLPFIIGKAGSNIQAIEDQFKVAVNLSRETHELEITGLKPNVIAAMAEIKSMIDTNKEVEEVIKVEKHILLGCLIGSGGTIIKGINRDFGVRVESEGAKEDQFQTIKIRGTNAKVIPAKNHILNLIQTFVANTLVFEVPDEFMAVLLGKGGSSIKSLREKFPEVNIDIDKNKIHIQSANPALRAAVKADIDAVIEVNFTETIEMSEDCIIQLKSQRGVELREELLGKNYNLKLIMDKSNSFVKVRGLKLNVLRGIQKLEQFKNNFTTVKIPIHEDDYPIFFKNGIASEDSLIKSIETKYDIEILSVRKELSFVIRGSPKGVKDAQAHVEGFLAGNPEYGAVLTSLDTLVYSAMIGKSGANIKKMEEEYSVKFDILKSRNLLRIRGETDKLVKARAAVHAFIDNTRVTDFIAIPATFVRSKLEGILKTASDIYQLEVVVSPEDPNKLVVKGIYILVEEAKVYLQDQLNGRCKGQIALLPKHVTAIGSRVAENFKRLHDKHGVTFELNASANTLVISGETNNVNSAKIDAMKFLESFFPTEVHGIEVPSHQCMRDILGWDLSNEVTQFGATLNVHRPILRLFLLSESNAGLNAAKAIVQSKFSQWNDLHEVIPFEEFMYPMIIGKNGAAIAALCKENQVTIDINRTLLRLEVTGATKKIVQDAKQVIAEKIEKYRSEHFEMPVASDMIGFVIGKQGATINKIRTESEAAIEFDAKLGVLKITGGAEKIQKAREMVQEILTAEEKNRASVVYVAIPQAAIPAVIGTKGNTSKNIQNVSGARLDIDRTTNRCVLKGSEEACAKAKEMIEAVLEEGGFNKAVEVPAPVVVAPVPEPVKVEEETPAAAPVANGRGVKVVPGASPELIQRMQEKSMSKSALKRLRKKEAANTGESAEDASEPEVPAAPVAAPIPAPAVKVAAPAPAAPKPVAAPVKSVTPPPALEPADEPIVFKPAVVVPIAAPATSSTSALAGIPLQIGQLPSISITSKPAAAPAPVAAPAPAAVVAPVAPVAVAASQPPGLMQPALSNSFSSDLLPAAPGLKPSGGPTPVSFPGFAMFGPPKAVGGALGGLTGPPGMSQPQPVGPGVIGRAAPATVIPPRVNPQAAGPPASASYASFDQPISGFDTIKIGNVEIPNISSANGSSSYFPRGQNDMIINEASNLSGLSANAPNFLHKAQQPQQPAYGGYSHEQQQQILLQQQQQYQAQQYAAAQRQQQQQQQQQMNYGRVAQPPPQQVQQSWGANPNLQFNAKPAGLSPPGLFSQASGVPAAPQQQPQPYSGNAWGQRAALAQQQLQQQQQQQQYANNMYASTAAAANANNNGQQSRML